MGEYLVFELLGDIYQLPIDGGSARPIINGPEFASQPRLSPDGSRLVFVSDRSGEDNLGPSAEIMKVDLSGGHSDTVSAVRSPAIKPMLSSDGKW